MCVERYCVVKTIPDGCGERYGSDAADALRIGVALPITAGAERDESEVQSLNALRLGLGEVNQRQGVNGRAFALEVCDTAADTERLKTQLAYLLDLGVIAAVTSGSSATFAAASLTVPRDVLLISPTATSPELTDFPDKRGGSVGLVWRTAPSDAIQGEVISRLIATDSRFDGKLKIAVLYQDDPYGQGLSAVVLQGLQARLRTSQGFLFVRGGDVAGAVDQVAAYAPDLTVVIAFPDDARKILNLAATRTALTRTAGHSWFFSDSARDPALVNVTAPGELEGAFGTAPAQGAGLEFNSFRGRFQSTYGIDPFDYSFTAHSYDTFYLLVLATAGAMGTDGQGALTGPRLAEALTRVSSGSTFRLSPDQLTGAKAALASGGSIDVDGASGELNFDPDTGEAPSKIELWQIDAGKIVTRENLDP